jgi:hypothetical protein
VLRGPGAVGAAGLGAQGEYRLPACRAACVVNPRDEEDFASARAAARAAIAVQPFEIEGPMRERYFSSAGDSRLDLTEIQFPLRPS